MSDDDAGVHNGSQFCWICLDGADGAKSLVSPCKCPRVAHAHCLARWVAIARHVLTLPDWRPILTPAHIKPSTPVVSVHYNGMPMLECMQVTFQCKSPDNAQELSLKGISAFDAAIHCASVSAAERAAHAQRNGPHHAAQSLLPAAFSPSTPPPISPSHQTMTGPSPAGTATHPPSSTLILPAIVSHPVARSVVSLDYSSRSAAAGAAAAGRPGAPRAHSLDQGPLTESQWGAVQEGRRGNGGEGRGSTWRPDPGLASGEREGTEDNKPSQKLLRMGALRDFFRRMFVTEWRFSLYSQLEVITARMLGAHVPPSSATVVQLHGSTRALFYYPKNTKQVIAVAPDLTPGELAIGWAAMEGSMPQGKAKQPTTRYLATGSVDAVTCLGALAGCQEDQQGRVLAEVVRVLRPGAPCVIIEPGSATQWAMPRPLSCDPECDVCAVSDGASPVRWLLSQIQGKALAAARLEELLGIAGLEVVQVDVALEGADPHAVGLVRRSSAAWQALPGRAAVAAPQAKGFKAGSRK
ncbi:hypothetical protein QJQ45_027800 [Haematococcus lacustris]|nr:hypothetical protein QJQ45_027800 [Haematococcus lacustris]